MPRPTLSSPIARALAGRAALGRSAFLRALALGLVIGLAGLASTALRVELLPGMHLVAIPAAPLLAAVLLGPLGGAVAGAVAGLGTVWLWGHGYALSLLVLEGVGVGILRRRLSPVLADAAYWAASGTWAALLVYGTPLGLDVVRPAALSATLKVGANSLLAALVVHVVLLLPPVRARLRHLLPPPLARFSVRVMLRLVLACVVVLPLAVVAVLQAQGLLSTERARLADTNTRTAHDVVHRLERELRAPMQAVLVLAGTLRAEADAGAPPPSAEELGRSLRARLAVSPGVTGVAVLEARGGTVLAHAVRPPATPEALAAALQAFPPGAPPGPVQVGGMLLAAAWVEGPRPDAVRRLVVASVDLQRFATEAATLLHDAQRLAVLGPDGRPALEASVAAQRLVPDPQLEAVLRAASGQAQGGAPSQPRARAAVVQALGRLHLGAATLAPVGWRVVVATPEAALLPGLHAQLGRMLLGLLLALVLALAGGEALGRLLTRPLDQLAAVAGRLGRGERQARLGGAVAHGPREVADVGRAFDAMADAQAEQLETQQRAHARLRAAQSRLEDADRRKDEFLGMLSHELRNPLAPIRNSLYILDHAEPTGPQARRAREVVNRQVTHLTRLVDDLLDVTRIARGKVELRRAKLDLAAVARRTAEDYRALMHERDLELVVDVPDAALAVDGDETRIAQVLGNLLSNAAKFTPAGGRVTLAAERSRGRALVHVRDTGVGIAPDLLPTIFDPFTQAKQELARSEGGLGLGLALVKGLTELHGGRVVVSSTPGSGTRFTVELPLASPAETPGGPDATRPRTGTYRVLVVDDNADAAESLAELVRMFGHQVEVVYDGPSAVARVAANRPDVVLCDLGLPGMDGYEVAKALRARIDGGIQLVAVSGYAQPEDVKRSADAGFDAHIAKPPDPASIERLFT